MLKGTDKPITEPCHVLILWMNGEQEKNNWPASHIFREREINVKQDMEAEDLKNETFETVGSLGASGIGAQFGDCWERNLKFLSVSNVVEIEGGFSKHNPVATFL